MVKYVCYVCHRPTCHDTHTCPHTRTHTHKHTDRHMFTFFSVTTLFYASSMHMFICLYVCTHIVNLLLNKRTYIDIIHSPVYTCGSTFISLSSGVFAIHYMRCLFDNLNASCLHQKLENSFVMCCVWVVVMFEISVSLIKVNTYRSESVCCVRRGGGVGWVVLEIVQAVRVGWV